MDQLGLSKWAYLKELTAGMIAAVVMNPLIMGEQIFMLQPGNNFNRYSSWRAYAKHGGWL